MVLTTKPKPKRSKKLNKYLVIAVFAVVAIAGLCVRMYGNARFAEGVSSSNASQSKAVSEKTTEATEILKEEQNVADKIPSSDLDNVGASLGILRRSEDY